MCFSKGPFATIAYCMQRGRANESPDGPVGVTRERDYFEAPQPPFNSGAFPCRLEPVLFRKTRLAQYKECDFVASNADPT